MPGPVILHALDRHPDTQILCRAEPQPQQILQHGAAAAFGLSRAIVIVAALQAQAGAQGVGAERQEV
ncbi:hypothetical protein B7R22_01810 [Subtercola boreus]|uniref:Uncharacterized protein n=1 Tax=Subtercola boreus TaxID=120213 RepID=A0A3E0W4W2_9MICO|nr:hypothetical protein [Subtercola boreus]RFA17050.1 hypothetical protein B7R22_01810 [Subtercola boreus]